MRLVCTSVVAAVAHAAEWEAVRRMIPEQKIEVVARDGTRTRATFLSASDDTLKLREETAERSIVRADIKQVRAQDDGRRFRHGLIWTAVGAGAGAGLGAAVCPYCANEGHGTKFIGPGLAIGAGIGALGFLTSPYRIVYKAK